MAFHWLQVLKDKTLHALNQIDAELTGKQADLKKNFDESHEEEAKARAASALMNIASSVDVSAIPNKQSGEDTSTVEQTTTPTNGETLTDKTKGE